MTSDQKYNPPSDPIPQACNRIANRPFRPSLADNPKTKSDLTCNLPPDPTLQACNQIGNRPFKRSLAENKKMAIASDPVCNPPSDPDKIGTNMHPLSDLTLQACNRFKNRPFKCSPAENKKMRSDPIQWVDF